MVELRLELGLDSEADAVELDESTRQLRDELLELDVEAVVRPSGGLPPEGARAADVAVLGALLVTVSQQVIGALVRVVGDWLSRGARRTVKLQIGDDSIELTAASGEDQRRLLDAFLARHAAPSG